MAIITPTGPILDLYKYFITLNVYKRTLPGVHLENLRFYLYQRDMSRDPNQPVDDRHTTIAEVSGIASPITFPVSAATDYFLRVTKSGYHRAERNLGWRVIPDKFKWQPLIYGERFGIIQGPNWVWSEDIAPAGVIKEEYLARWGTFDILMDVGGGEWTGEGTLILDKGFGIKTLACSGKYRFDKTVGDWVYVSEEYTNTKAADIGRYLQYHYPNIPFIWIATYQEWSPTPPSQMYYTYYPPQYPPRPPSPGTPEGNENNFQLWIVNEEGEREAEAFEYYIDPTDPNVQDRYRIDFK